MADLWTYDTQAAREVNLDLKIYPNQFWSQLTISHLTIVFSRNNTCKQKQAEKRYFPCPKLYFPRIAQPIKSISHFLLIFSHIIGFSRHWFIMMYRDTSISHILNLQDTETRKWETWKRVLAMSPSMYRLYNESLALSNS